MYGNSQSGWGQKAVEMSNVSNKKTGFKGEETSSATESVTLLLYVCPFITGTP